MVTCKILTSDKISKKVIAEYGSKLTPFPILKLAWRFCFYSLINFYSTLPFLNILHCSSIFIKIKNKTGSRYTNYYSGDIFRNFWEGIFSRKSAEGLFSSIFEPHPTIYPLKVPTENLVICRKRAEL